MKEKKYHKSTLARARQVRQITAKYYEKGNNSKCYRQVWRYYIYPEFGCCYTTFLKFMKLPDYQEPRRQEDRRQLFLF